MTYKKVGGLHFFSLGRFGLTFYIKKHRYSHITADAIGRAVKRKENLDRLRGALHPIERGVEPRFVDPLDHFIKPVACSDLYPER